MNTSSRKSATTSPMWFRCACRRPVEEGSERPVDAQVRIAPQPHDQRPPVHRAVASNSASLIPGISTVLIDLLLAP